MSVISDDDKPSDRLSDENGSQDHQGHTKRGESGRNADETGASTSGYAVTSEPSGGQPDNKTRKGEPVVHAGTLQGSARAVSISTWLLFGVNVATLSVIVLQWISMEGQLGEMKESNKGLLKAIEQSEHQVKAAEDANTIARSALASADRPWLSSKIILADANDAGDIAFRVVIGNDGKAPAQNVKYKYEIKVVPSFRETISKFVPPDLGSKNSTGPITIFSSDKIEDVLSTTKNKIDKATSGPYSGKLINIIGQVNYVDSYRISHETKTCVGYDSKLNNIGPCTMEFDAIAN